MIVKILNNNSHFMTLVQNPFGNYAIQTTIECIPAEELSEIFNILLKNVLALSIQKFSSNVIEKCLDFCNDYFKEQFVIQITMPDVMKSLIKNTYGFYVIQKLLQIHKEREDLTFKICMEVENNLQYISEKGLWQKWVGLLKVSEK